MNPKNRHNGSLLGLAVADAVGTTLEFKSPGAFTPISDMRASALYRQRVSQNLLQRFFLEQMDSGYPVRLDSHYGHASGSERNA